MNAKLDSNGRGEWVVRLVEECCTEVDAIVAAAERVHAESKWWIDELTSPHLSTVGQGDVPKVYGKPRVVAIHGCYVVLEILIPSTLYNSAQQLVAKKRKQYTLERVARYGGKVKS